MQITARLKSCPFKSFLAEEFFRSLFSPYINTANKDAGFSP